MRRDVLPLGGSPTQIHTHPQFALVIIVHHTIRPREFVRFRCRGNMQRIGGPGRSPRVVVTCRLEGRCAECLHPRRHFGAERFDLNRSWSGTAARGRTRCFLNQAHIP